MVESGVAFFVADGLAEESGAGCVSFAVELSDVMWWGEGGKFVRWWMVVEGRSWVDADGYGGAES